METNEPRRISQVRVQEYCEYTLSVLTHTYKESTHRFVCRKVANNPSNSALKRKFRYDYEYTILTYGLGKTIRAINTELFECLKFVLNNTRIYKVLI